MLCLSLGLLSSSGCSAHSLELWGLYRDLKPSWAPSFQLLCFANLVLKALLNSGTWGGSLSFFTASLCITFSVYAFIYNKCVGGSLESQVSMLLEETPCRLIEVIPKWGSKMDIGSEVIVCCAKVIFKNGLPMCETKILPFTKIEFVSITQNGVCLMCEGAVSVVPHVRSLGRGLRVCAR